MTDAEIFQIAKSCGFDISVDDREKLKDFAWEIYGIASDETLQDYESKF